MIKQICKNDEIDLINIEDKSRIAEIEAKENIKKYLNNEFEIDVLESILISINLKYKVNFKFNKELFLQKNERNKK